MIEILLIFIVLTLFAIFHFRKKSIQNYNARTYNGNFQNKEDILNFFSISKDELKKYYLLFAFQDENQTYILLKNDEKYYRINTSTKNKRWDLRECLLQDLSPYPPVDNFDRESYLQALSPISEIKTFDKEEIEQKYRSVIVKEFMNKIRTEQLKRGV